MVTGDTLTWTNTDGLAHTTTSGIQPTPDGTWDSGVLGPGDAFSFIVPSPGSFPYFSTLDPSDPTYVGTVQVVNADAIAITNVFLRNGDVVLEWLSPDSRKYDLLVAHDLLLPTPFQVVEPGLPPQGGGTYSLTNPPFLSSPLFACNTNLFYALQALPSTQQLLSVQLDVIAGGLVSPVRLTHAGDGSDRLFIVDQVGHIRVVDSSGSLVAAPFLDISNKVAELATNFDERGLLGLAFHPAYTNNGRFFVYYSAPKSASGVNHESVVAEYHVSAGDPNVADTNETIILRQDEPQANHNAGQLAFGPDGFLYVAFGDGGGSGDAHGSIGNGQNLTNWLGSILRIDVDGGAPYAVPPDNPFVGSAGRDEIYAYGFRNPYQFSFDRGDTHRLIVADVGQSFYEEIDFVEKGSNYGWRIMEGHHAFDAPLAETVPANIKSLAYPVHAYHHHIGGISIIGGYVYRGTNFPELVGRYVFGDFSRSFAPPDGRLFYLEETRTGIWERFEFHLAPNDVPLGRYVKGFGEDERGEVYLLSSPNLGPTGNDGDVRLIRKP